MGKFLTPLITEKVEGTDDQWELFQDLIYQSDVAGLITVKAGYKTDFASVPRPLWILFPKDGRWDGAAVIHDWAYGAHAFPRSECDAIFLEAMKVLGVGWLTRHLLWSGVRVGGWAFY